jgi:hypothetical protein
LPGIEGRLRYCKERSPGDVRLAMHSVHK